MKISHENDGTINLWDPATGECLDTLDGHTRSVNALAVLPDGRLVDLVTLEGHNKLALLPDGRLASAPRA